MDRLHPVKQNPAIKAHLRPGTHPCEGGEFTMANSYDKQPKLGIPPETAGPLIALVITCISALVVVLVLLARDKRPDEPVRD